MQNKENRGGARKGSGPKLKYKERTKTISFRVPESKFQEIKEKINELLKEYKENGK
jgi:hypothetical protein